MAFSTAHTFYGEFDGEDVDSLRKKFNYNRTTKQARLNVIDEMLNDTDFFLDYFEHSFKVNINTGEALSEDNDVCKLVQSMTNYLLNCDEEKDFRKTERDEANYIVDMLYFSKKIDKEDERNGFHENGEVKSTIRHETNVKKVAPFSVNGKDLKEDSVCGEILREYHSYYKDMKQLSQTPNRRYVATRQMGLIKEDMLYTKLGLKKCFGEQFNPQEMGNKEAIDLIDFGEQLHVRRLISSFNFDGHITFENEMSLLYYDFEQLVLEMSAKDLFTSLQGYVLFGSLYGLKNKEMQEFLDSSKQLISKTLDVVAKKVSTYYRKNK